MSRASERQREREAEMARRRTARGAQRQQFMEQRKQGAQTAYMARMGERVGGQAGRAIAMGMDRPQYVKFADDMRTSEARRDVAYITARSPQEVERMRGRNQLDLQRGELDDRAKARQHTSMENREQRTHESGLQKEQLGVSRERLIADQAAAARDYALKRDDLKLRQQQAAWDATAPTYVPGMGMVSRGADGGYSVTSEIEMMEAGLSDEERLARARQRAIDASYARGNWFQDTGNFLFGHPGQ